MLGVLTEIMHVPPYSLAVYSKLLINFSYYDDDDDDLKWNMQPWILPTELSNFLFVSPNVTALAREKRKNIYRKKCGKGTGTNGESRTGETELGHGIDSDQLGTIGLTLFYLLVEPEP